jgi:hypothetical protein
LGFLLSQVSQKAKHRQLSIKYLEFARQSHQKIQALPSSPHRIPPEYQYNQIQANLMTIIDLGSVFFDSHT